MDTAPFLKYLAILSTDKGESVKLAPGYCVIWYVDEEAFGFANEHGDSVYFRRGESIDNKMPAHAILDEQDFGELTRAIASAAGLRAEADIRSARTNKLYRFLAA